jgi:hypothetical protein
VTPRLIVALHTNEVKSSADLGETWEPRISE